MKSTNSAYLRERELYDGQLKNFFHLTYSVCDIFDSIDKLIESKFSRDSQVEYFKVVFLIDVVFGDWPLLL